MLTSLTGYFRPKSIPEALALLQKNSGSILIIAGGTKLVLSHNDTVQELVDITSLNLNFIKDENNVIRIGATTPLQRIIESPLLRSSPYSIVSEAGLLSQYSRMIRNVSTLGGELVSSGSLSLLYCALMVLQAQVRIAGGEEFALAMNIFLNKKRLSGGIIMEVLIPKVTQPTHAGLHFVSTNPESPPLIAACARVSTEGRLCRNVKIAITGTPKVAQRMHHLESELEGRPFTRQNIERVAERVYDFYHPRSDSYASEEFRKEISRSVVKQALTKCWEVLEG